MKKASIILTCILFLSNFPLYSYSYNIDSKKEDEAEVQSDTTNSYFLNSQTKDKKEETPEPKFEGLYLLDETYQITSGDIIMVYLIGDISEAYSFSVLPDGKIFIPRIGEIKVADLNIKECKETIKNEISKYYKNMDIDIIVHIIKPSLKRTISKVADIITVDGEVNYPGIYNIAKGERISSVIYRAGGFKQRADLRRAYIERNKNRKDIDLHTLLIMKDSSLDIETENGDILYIPAKSNVVNVSGNVYKPGAYEYFLNAPVSYYLGFAGGITKEGSDSITIIQFDGKEVNSEDYIPQSGDTIYVPQKFFSLTSWRDYMQIFFDFLAIYSIYTIIFKK